MVKKITAKERKINVLIGFTQGEIAFLDRKIDKKHSVLSSRAAIVRYLVCHARMHPVVLDVSK